MKKIIILLLALCMVFCFVSCDNKTPEPEDVVPNVIIGTGTEKDPYAIKSFAAFKQLGSDEWQAKIEKGENEGVYYRLDCDIDLSKEAPSTYFIKAFGGTFDGNGHTIKGNNNISYIFNYLFADTTIKNVKLDFDTESITRLWYQLVVKGTITKTDPKEGPMVAYDKDTIGLTFENVDFVPKSNHSYFIGDNNAGLYQLNSPYFATVLSEGKYKDFYIEYALKDEKEVKYTIKLKGCDVYGNYNGGFGGSSAAVFFGGQLCGVGIVLEDCSFNGTLEGLNVTMLFANKSGCDDSPVTLTNVRNNGTIKSYTNKGTLYYGVNASTLKGATITGEITGNSINQVDPSLTLTNPGFGKQFDFSTLEGEAELKLFLPSVYTYDGDSYLYRTDSNTITIPVTNETKDIYVAKVVSTDDIVGKEGYTLVDWNEVNTETKEGSKYQFVDHDSEKYMVLNYGVSVSKFYTKKDDGSTVFPQVMKNAMLLQRGENNEIKAVSNLVKLN